MYNTGLSDSDLSLHFAVVIYKEVNTHELTADDEDEEGEYASEPYLIWRSLTPSACSGVEPKLESRGLSSQLRSGLTTPNERY